MSLDTLSGFENDTVSIHLKITNSDTFVAFQTDIIIPANITFIPNSAALTSRSNGHILSINNIHDNTFRIIAFSISQAAFSGNDGAVLTIQLNLGSSIGNFPIILENAIISNANSQNILTGVSNGLITVIDSMVPVRLTTFKGVKGRGGIDLKWESASELNNCFYIIERSIDDSESNIIAKIDSKGSGAVRNEYSYRDEISENEYRKVIYTLRQFDCDGSTSMLGEVVLHSDVRDEGFILFQNYPNPFNPSTVIGYSLAERGHVMLRLFDSLGHEIATLVDEEQEAGYYNYELGAHNLELASGVYFYEVRGADFRGVKKLVMMK